MNLNFKDLRFDELDTAIENITNDLASNLTDINTSLQLLESQKNLTETVTSNIAELQQKFEKLEAEDLPAMQKMVRSSVRQSRENYLSIDDLQRDQNYGSPGNQYGQSNFEMMNTLMVIKHSNNTA